MDEVPFPNPHDPDGPGSSGFRQKLAPERIALLRERVECTTLPFKRIGQELGISASTISRYAAEGGWKRPSGAAPAPVIARANPEPSRQRKDAPVRKEDRRERITEKLWRLAERHAEELEDQPVAVAQRSLQPLVRLTKTLGEIDKHIRRPLPDYEYEIDAPKPERNIHDLRQELEGHLERIVREEQDYEERWGRTFENGGGI